MKIIIEISGGVVAGVYAGGRMPRKMPRKLNAVVVDLDGAKVGEPTRPQCVKIEPLHHASDIVLEAVAKGEK